MANDGQRYHRFNCSTDGGTGGYGTFTGIGERVGENVARRIAPALAPDAEEVAGPDWALVAAAAFAGGALVPAGAFDTAVPAGVPPEVATYTSRSELGYCVCADRSPSPRDTG